MNNVKNVCTALNVVMKCGARQDRVSLQEEFNRFCRAYGDPKTVGGPKAPEDEKMMDELVGRICR